MGGSDASTDKGSDTSTLDGAPPNGNPTGADKPPPKILMVGAGGIGCELLKTLVLSGYTDLELVDLDSIDTSNLNRQFLFRKHHVGQPKAVVARRALSRSPEIGATHPSLADWCRPIPAGAVSLGPFQCGGDKG